MKRILSLVMALAMLLCLCACSAEPEEKFVPARGTVENGIYRNEVFGVSFSGGENWYFYGDEEIASTMGITIEEMFGGEYAENITEARAIYDMYCLNMATGETFNISYENLGAIYGTILDEKAYLETATVQLESQLVASGLTLVSSDIETVTVGGEELVCLNLVAEYMGVSIHETLAVKKIGDWMGIFTVASVDESSILGILEMVSFEG